MVIQPGHITVSNTIFMKMFLTIISESPQIYGSLTLGGYDENRMERNNVTFPFDGNADKPTSLKIFRISADDGNKHNLLDQEIYAELDFTVSHFW